MKHLLCGLLAIGALAVLGSCDSGSPGLILGDQVGVQLVNDTDYDVDVVIRYHEDPDVSESTLTDDGPELDYAVQSGESINFQRDCDHLGAIIVESATLRVLGGLGPTADTRVFRDGEDFSCRDTIVFTFEGSLLDFGITWDVP